MADGCDADSGSSLWGITLVIPMPLKINEIMFVLATEIQDSGSGAAVGSCKGPQNIDQEECIIYYNIITS